MHALHRGLGSRSAARPLPARANCSRRRASSVRRVVAASSLASLPQPDGSLGLPVVGETLELVWAGDTFGSSRRERYGDVYKTHLLGAPVVMVYGEEAVTTVLRAEDKLVASDWPQATHVLVGPDSLNLLTGARHGTVKRALADAFSEKAVRQHVQRIAAVVQDRLSRLADGSLPAPGFAAMQEVSQAAFDVAVLGGDGSPSRAAELQELMAALQAGFQTPPLDLPFTAYGRAVAARARFGELVRAAVARYRAAGGAASDADAPPSALKDVLAAAAAADGTDGASRPLSDSVLEDNVVAGFFGNASTGPSLAKALQYLSGEAGGRVLQRLRDEQQAIVARLGHEDITAAVLDEMPYGTAVARELLRITPAVPAVFRVAIEDFELQGRLIPKGWRVWLHLGDSVLLYNRDAFVPERWLEPQQEPVRSEASAALPGADATTNASSSSNGGGCPMRALSASAAAPQFSLPFGTGVRTCLGRNLVMAELLVLLAVLARKYDVQADAGEVWRVVPAPAPAAGLPVWLRRRA